MPEAPNTTFPHTKTLVTSSDGVQIFAEAVGNPQLPSLVFIHGLSQSALVWARILKDPSLLAHFYMVAYDTRGHGRSGKPNTLAEYSSSLYADDFAAVAKAFDLTKPLLVGWSLGAAVAADVTTYLKPGTLSGIIYAAGVPSLEVREEVSSTFMLSFGPGRHVGNDNSTPANISQLNFITSLFSRPEDVPTETLWSWLGASVLPDPPKYAFLMGRTQKTTNLFKAGAEGLPLLVVNGGADKFLLGDKVLEFVGGHFKDITVYNIENGSHAFFYEDHDEFVAQVVQFASVSRWGLSAHATTPVNKDNAAGPVPWDSMV